MRAAGLRVSVNQVTEQLPCAHLPSDGEENLLQRSQAQLHVDDAELAAARFELPQEPRKLRPQRLGEQEL